MSTMIATTTPTSVPTGRTASAGPGDRGAAFGDVLAGSRVAAGAGARSGRHDTSEAAPHHGATSVTEERRGRDGVDAGGSAVVGSREHGAATGDGPGASDGAAVAADATGTTLPAPASSTSTAGAVPLAFDPPPPPFPGVPPLPDAPPLPNEPPLPASEPPSPPSSGRPASAISLLPPQATDVAPPTTISTHASPTRINLSC